MRKATLCAQAQSGAIATLRAETRAREQEHHARLAMQRAEMTLKIEEAEEDASRRWPKWVTAAGAAATFAIGLALGVSR